MSKRGRELVRTLEKVIKQEHLYTDEQLRKMKTQLRVVKEELAKIESQQSKGFGR